MIIETKFDSTDKVWVIDVITVPTWECNESSVSIVDAEIYADEDGSSVFYHRNGSCELIDEEECFATQQEAQDECDKRNKAKLG